jgi:hypothetical protein
LRIYANLPEAGLYQVLVREVESLSAKYTIPSRKGRKIVEREQPKRLIYAEALEIDAALTGGPTGDTSAQL